MSHIAALPQTIFTTEHLDWGASLVGEETSLHLCCDTAAAKKVRKWRRSEAAAPAIPRTGSSSLIAKVRVVDSPPDPLLPCAPLAAARGGAHCAPQARATSSPLRLRSRGARPVPQVKAVDGRSRRSAGSLPVIC